MSPSTFTRAAFAAGLLASGVSAAFESAAKTNIAVYWGQGNAQIPLSEVCADPNIDIVNIGFINSFPSVRGSYPGSNHANACSSDVYFDPVLKKNSTLFSSCPGVGEAITACQKSGKKVMLSLGGGWPTNYYLPTPDVAEWFAEFLIGAYGAPTTAWKAANKPRPFGDAVVDGFDLDLEAQTYDMPSSEYIYKNYDFFGKYVKDHSAMLLSVAPQCVVPDVRISPVLQAVPFDFLFTQFYNTRDCSAALEVSNLKEKKPSTFTFDKWISEIKTSANPNLKFYIGLAAGPDGLPVHKDHYLEPQDANFLVEKYKGNANFGGVMLWEASVSVRNPTYGQSHGAWMKYAVEGTFGKNFHPVVSSSTRVSTSTTKASTTKTSSSTPVSSTKAPSTKVSSTTPISSSKILSSTPVSSKTLVSSSKISSSTPTPSTLVTSSKASSSGHATSSAASSSAHATSSKASSSSSSAYDPSSSSAAVLSSVASSSSSVASSSSAYVTLSAESVSSVATLSSTMIEPSSIATISASASSSELIYVPNLTGSASSIESVSSTFIEPSSVATISASESFSTSVHVVSSSETPASSGVYSSVSSSSGIYSSGAYSATTSEGVSSTSCSTSSGAYSTSASSSDIYSSKSSSTSVYSESTPEAAFSTPYAEYNMSSVAYSSGIYSTASPVHPTETYSANKGMDNAVYSAESSKSSAASSTGHESAPSVTKKPEHSEYPSVPTDSTTTVVTTTYVDVCPTGLTTVTTTYVTTVCTKCTKPKGSTDVPEGWTTSAYTASTVTVTLTKPIATATDTPAYPSSAPSVAYPADYPAKPVSSGKPANPAVPEASIAYSAVPKASKAASSSSSSSSAAATAGNPSHRIASEYPKKPVEQDVTSTVRVTLTKVPVPTYTPAPYPTAGGAPYVPTGPAKNGTSMHAPIPTGTGTGKPAMPSSYAPPAEFTGAASRAGAGFRMIVGVVGAVLVLL